MKTKETKCPVCEHLIDGVTHVGCEDVIPEVDDVTVCIYCSTILAFNTDLTLRLMTDEQIGELDHEMRRQLQTARRTIKQLDN